ncbi:sigma-54-dependent transcriptional regulator [Pedobacter mendelii]|uniref:Sigma-54-dependent Fis family transcriptional regulator n=1 Tax=Pedobacter mendelii TaxID=1908240 RepID=A0ABQ2BN59_9SPHI|nr:sigma-54 dependent transcriptional regulator [Pedobacter mendelii]GGI28635.1 sigma-54-dependent Fis family transcriptional regulator [Pedobacter mendelii]
MLNSILILEDEKNQRNLYARVLRTEGYTVFEAGSIDQARKFLKKNIQVAIIDAGLPDGDGIDFIVEIKKTSPHMEIIVFTGRASINDGIKAIKNGAFDYLIKGDVPQKLFFLVAQAMSKAVKQIQESKKNINTTGFDAIIGESAAIKKIKAIGIKVAATYANVLLLGDTGVGKDILAEAIHKASECVNEPFVAINCSALGAEVLESELFGYKAGAFTGAVKDKKGLFEEANKGTIFLDEIGDMSLLLQSKILRVLENGSFIKVGDTKTSYTNCRIIAATHVNLLEAVKNGRFREDLYYRIAAFIIYTPSLSERATDIPLLAKHYIAKLAAKMEMPVPKITTAFLNALSAYSWPGNVRELINVIERSLILSSGILTIDLLELNEENKSRNSSLLEDFELNHIKYIVEECNGNKVKAARLLGISVATLYRKLGLKY